MVYLLKSALITGVTGQDGAYLASFLLKRGYKVFGTFRRVSSPNLWRLQYLGIHDRVVLIPADLIDAGSIANAMRVADPDEIYHLAAQSFVEASFEQPTATGDVTGLSVTRILDTMRIISPEARFYQASSSEMFGDGHSVLQNEKTPFRPASPYSAAKLYGFWITRIYREAHKLFATNGILFNHESPLRGLDFVTRKVSNGVAMIKHGIIKSIRIGNLNAKRDWGFAPEYVETMWKMLQQNKPDDYIISTGVHHSVKELLDLAFRAADLDWRDHVTVDKRLFRPLEVPSLKGDYSKANKVLGWNPKVSFEELIKEMVNADMSRWKKSLQGDVFPWDVPGSLLSPTEKDK